MSAYSSDGSTIYGVVPEKHKCKPWNGETFQAPQGTLLRCPCGAYWYKRNAYDTSAERAWQRIGWLWAWWLRRRIDSALTGGSTPNPPSATGSNAQAQVHVEPGPCDCARCLTGGS